MKKDIDPLDPELRSLFDAEADFPPEPAATRASVWDKVQGAITVAPLVSSDAGGSSPPPASGALSKSTIAALAFLAGGLTGAGAYHFADRTPPPLVAPADTPALVADAGASNAKAPPPAFSAVVAPPPAVSAPEPPALRGSLPPSIASTRSPTTDLARERAIIDVARTAVARNRLSAALEAINRHAREFPKGQLSEEREGLRVLALARDGKSDEARERAAAFKKRYPKSMLLPATEDAVEQEKKP
jgi:hypothetical protein